MRSTGFFYACCLSCGLFFGIFSTTATADAGLIIRGNGVYENYTGNWQYWQGANIDEIKYYYSSFFFSPSWILSMRILPLLIGALGVGFEYYRLDSFAKKLYFIHLIQEGFIKQIWNAYTSYIYPILFSINIAAIWHYVASMITRYQSMLGEQHYAIPFRLNSSGMLMVELIETEAGVFYDICPLPIHDRYLNGYESRFVKLQKVLSEENACIRISMNGKDKSNLNVSLSHFDESDDKKLTIKTDYTFDWVEEIIVSNYSKIPDSRKYYLSMLSPDIIDSILDWLAYEGYNIISIDVSLTTIKRKSEGTECFLMDIGGNTFHFSTSPKENISCLQLTEADNDTEVNNIKIKSHHESIVDLTKNAAIKEGGFILLELLAHVAINRVSQQVWRRYNKIESPLFSESTSVKQLPVLTQRGPASRVSSSLLEPYKKMSDVRQLKSLVNTENPKTVNVLKQLASVGTGQKKVSSKELLAMGFFSKGMVTVVLYALEHESNSPLLFEQPRSQKTCDLLKGKSFYPLRMALEGLLIGNAVKDASSVLNCLELAVYALWYPGWFKDVSSEMKFTVEGIIQIAKKNQLFDLINRIKKNIPISLNPSFLFSPCEKICPKPLNALYSKAKFRGLKPVGALVLGTVSVVRHLDKTTVRESDSVDYENIDFLLDESRSDQTHSYNFFNIKLYGRYLKNEEGFRRFIGSMSDPIIVVTFSEQTNAYGHAFLVFKNSCLNEYDAFQIRSYDYYPEFQDAKQLMNYFEKDGAWIYGAVSVTRLMQLYDAPEPNFDLLQAVYFPQMIKEWEYNLFDHNCLTFSMLSLQALGFDTDAMMKSINLKEHHFPKLWIESLNNEKHQCVLHSGENSILPAFFQTEKLHYDYLDAVASPWSDQHKHMFYTERQDKTNEMQ